MRQGGCGYHHGSQCTRYHGQGRTEEADREYEIPGVHGTVASVEEHCGVSASWCQPNHQSRRHRRRHLHPLAAYHFSSLPAYYSYTSVDPRTVAFTHTNAPEIPQFPSIIDLLANF